MDTIFSHIVQKRFSKVNEDIATDGLAYILKSHQQAHLGMMKWLRSIEPELPDLEFITQKADGNIRPDIWASHNGSPYLFIENKFWAGLTDNQPVAYLKRLADLAENPILLFIAPEARKGTLWRELDKRLHAAGIDRELITADSSLYLSKSSLGPLIALTTWGKVLSVLELEASEDSSAMNNLQQLRSLCDSADSDAFVPLDIEDVTDHRIPTLIFRLSEIMQAVVDKAVGESVLNTKGLMPQHSSERSGRYARFGTQKGVGIWLGTNFWYWKKYGISPLWLVINNGEFGRFYHIRPRLKKWIDENDLFMAEMDGESAIPIQLVCGEDKDRVVDDILVFLSEMKELLSDFEESYE